MRALGSSEEKIADGVYMLFGPPCEDLFEATLGWEGLVETKSRLAAAPDIPSECRPGGPTFRHRLALFLMQAETGRKLRKMDKPEKPAATPAVAPATPGASIAPDVVPSAQFHPTDIARGPQWPLPDPERSELLRRTALANKGMPTLSWPMRMFNRLMGRACSLLGTAMIFAYMITTGWGQRVFPFPIPPQILQFLRDEYVTWGWGGHYYALIAGGLLAGTASARRPTSALVLLAGCALLVMAKPAVELVNSPRFDTGMALFFGGILILMGSGGISALSRSTRFGGGGLLRPFF
ncbi:MAG: hypothetical protein V2A74_08890 [bacterium]